ncbi:response regulator transcription factor [Nocardiopsis dassonvillei]|uniref:winged helix-turn-helix transcriptional regulator n=1 Tax=Nocardiopsis dassonvillei TaxID=2014 RepID=UPI0020100125|nr:response regulator transcription factor [Nocardiopsis dassonvillei]MCK9871314.1 response regulator transcription factor [Nocardiopsis dassonvillei]
MEAEADLSHEMVLDLGSRNLEIGVCTDSAQALLRIGMARPDVLIIGVDVPGLSLDRLITAVREAMGVPIIVGADPDDAERATRALESGAMACVARPYRAAELAALVHASAPEGLTEPERVWRDSVREGRIELDPRGHRVRVDGQPVSLAMREFQLLKYLLDHAGLVVTREQIWREVWNRELPPVHNTIAVHIRRLRDKLRKGRDAPRYIHTVRGVGYRLDADAA